MDGDKLISPWDWAAIPDDPETVIIVTPVTAIEYCGELLAAIPAMLGNSDFAPRKDFDGAAFHHTLRHIWIAVQTHQPQAFCAHCIRQFVQDAATIRLRFKAFAAEKNARLTAAKESDHG
jgi:hypothetical protein